MSKKVLSLILSVIIVLSVFTVIPFSVSASTSGKCGSNAYWTLSDDGVFTISGTGSMYDYYYANSPYYDIKDRINQVKIEKGITGIGAYAFYNFTSMMSVTIPDSVTSIGYAAFEDCDSITSMIIPDSVTGIGYYAFYGCDNLLRVTIPSSVTRIGDSAFYGCKSLTSVIIPSSVTKIGKRVFMYCRNLSSVIIPNAVTIIDEEAFYLCSNLTSVTIPDSITSIGKDAFSYCSSLTNITIPNSVTSIGSNIGDNPFYGCSKLESLTVESNNQQFISKDGVLFSKDMSRLICYPAGKANSYYTIPNSVKIIYSYSFFGCENFTLVRIPDSVTYIGSHAFYYCTNVTSITIPLSVKNISSYAFEECNNLKDVYYGGSKEDRSKMTILDGRSGLFHATWHYNSTGPDELSDVDEYLIGQVKKYTSENPVGSDQYNAILNENSTNETKLKNLNEFFNNYGFTDAKEGIAYYRDTDSYRNDYKYLTTDDAFCAYNLYYYLNNTTKGQVARGLLWADGLLLNGELMSYLDVTDFAENDFPGVKKNKELLREFLEINIPKVQSLSNAKKSASTLSKILKLNDIVEEAEVKEIMDHVMNAKSDAELKKWQREFAEHITSIVEHNGKDKVYIDSAMFSKVLGYTSSVISFASATADDIYSMINLNQEIETYSQYSDFLTSIANCQYASGEMRMAAYSLLDDINNGYLNHIISIFGNVFSLEKDILTADTSLWEEILGANGALFGQALSTISLGAFISNLVVDTGDFVKNAAYVQGYAELAVIYSSFLQIDKTNFNSNPSKENAWKFFEDYTILWSLRKAGEEWYLKLNQIKMFIFGTYYAPEYKLKEQLVNTNINLLEQKQFEFAANYEIPDNVQYFSKAVINCPVDVYVYNQSGDLIVELKDGIESDVTNEYGRFAVMKQPYSGEYAKVIALNNPDSVVIKSVAYSPGLVDYSVAAISDNEIKSYSLNNVSVNNGFVISTSNDSQTYSVDYDGDEINDVEGQLIEDGDEYIEVEALVSGINNVDLSVGETQLLNIAVTPESATNKVIDWYTDNEDVVSVRNGLVEAIKPGEATVYARAMDSDDVILPFVVNVIPQATITGHSLTLSGDIGVNFYVDVPDEDVSNGLVQVDFAWTVEGSEMTHSVTLSVNDKYELGYKASCPVAVAEMTYDVTATVSIDGVVQSIPDTYSAQRYASVILNDENGFREQYIASENAKGKNGEKRYNDLISIVKTMLDYGAKAQVQFNRNVDHLANEGIDYTPTEVTADTIGDTGASDMRAGLAAYGLEYNGSSIVYLSETSMRHYYKIVDEDLFNAVKDNITFDGKKVSYTWKNGEIYFELKNIAAAELDDLYTLKIGDSEYKYSVLDYLKACLRSDKTTANMKALAAATYLYNQAANVYFD